MSSEEQPSDKLRVGIIGCGAGVFHLEGYSEDPRAEIVALAGLDTDRCNKLAAQFTIPSIYGDYQELLARDDIQAVSLAVPNNLHMPMALAAFEAGKHVLVEKPIARTAAEGEAMVAAAKKAFAGERPQELFTYLANWIESGGKKIPYSTITAMDFAAEPPLGPFKNSDGRPIEPLKDDEIVLNAWAANDLGAEVGDEVEIVGLRPTVKTTCTSIEIFRRFVDEGRAGDNAGILLRGVKADEVERGQVIAAPGSITPHTRFECEVYVLTKEEGGRHTPFVKGYEPQFYFRTTDVTGAISLPEDVELVMPGDTMKVSVNLFSPIAMEAGQRFAIREGNKTVGAGRVLTIG